MTKSEELLALAEALEDPEDYHDDEMLQAAAALREYAGMLDAQPSEFCCESAWRDAKALAWKQRDLNCGCDHNEYCGKCFPLDFRKGGKWDKYTHPPAPTTQEPEMDALHLAILFHHAYERLAPSVGYDTRVETRIFDPESLNGKLMLAVCAEILPLLPSPAPTTPLTDEEIDKIAASSGRSDGHTHLTFARAVLAAQQEKK